jgi:acetyl-CoA carboxylase alpha subunit
MDGDTKISPENLAMTIKDELIDKLAELRQLTSEELIEQRYERFRKF